MYIICAIITIPIGLLGYVILPGTPDKPNRLVLKQADIELAKRRLQRAGHSVQEHFRWKALVSIAGNWKFWALLLLDIFFWNGSINTTTGGYLLWLKSLKRFSTSRINELNAIAPALGIFYTLFICFSSDLLFGPAWAITIAHTWNIIGLVILVVWDVPQSALWFAFATTYSAVAMSSVLYGWVNSQLRYSPVERAVALIILNAVSQSTTAWTPLLVFKTVEGPRFTKGYSFVLGNAICLVILAHVIQFFAKREEYALCHIFIDTSNRPTGEFQKEQEATPTSATQMKRGILNLVIEQSCRCIQRSSHPRRRMIDLADMQPESMYAGPCVDE